MNKKDILELSGSIDYRIGNMSDPIHNVMTDSRQNLRNSVFIARNGLRNNALLYCEQAVSNGAVIVICEEKPDYPCDYIVCRDIASIQNELSQKVYSYPDRDLNIIGVTGTNGKTSSTYILQSIIRGIFGKCARAGTIDVDTGLNIYNSLNTFPEGPLFIRYLAEARNAGNRFFSCEVSSHALSLGRTDCIQFSYGIWTNLTRDHLDFHENMDEYFLAKRKLFQNIADKTSERGAAINTDCEYGKKIYQEFSSIYECVSFGYNDKADFRLLSFSENNGRSLLRFRFMGKEYEFSYNLSGDFNALNIAGCISILYIIFRDLDIILENCSNIRQIPGRMQKIETDGKNIFIDYAHTPDALERAVTALRKSPGKVILVFGCGGNRDKGKRYEMGKIACRYADFSVITDDNPRNEQSADIIRDIISGFEKENFIVIQDRKEAILKAIEIAEPEDNILVAGKGHEEYQEINGERKFFSDRKVIEDYANIMG